MTSTSHGVTHLHCHNVTQTGYTRDTYPFGLVLSVVRAALHSAAFPWSTRPRRTSLTKRLVGPSHNDEEAHCLMAAGVKIDHNLQHILNMSGMLLSCLRQSVDCLTSVCKSTFRANGQLVADSTCSLYSMIPSQAFA